MACFSSLPTELQNQILTFALSPAYTAMSSWTGKQIARDCHYHYRFAHEGPPKNLIRSTSEHLGNSQALAATCKQFYHLYQSLVEPVIRHTYALRNVAQTRRLEALYNSGFLTIPPLQKIDIILYVDSEDDYWDWPSTSFTFHVNPEYVQSGFAEKVFGRALSRRDRRLLLQEHVRKYDEIEMLGGTPACTPRQSWMPRHMQCPQADLCCWKLWSGSPEAEQYAWDDLPDDE
jgi:hypothetical protein